MVPSRRLTPLSLVAHKIQTLIPFPKAHDAQRRRRHFDKSMLWEHFKHKHRSKHSILTTGRHKKKHGRDKIEPKLKRECLYALNIVVAVSRFFLWWCTVLVRKHTLIPCVLQTRTYYPVDLVCDREQATEAEKEIKPDALSVCFIGMVLHGEKIKNKTANKMTVTDT